MASNLTPEQLELAKAAMRAELGAARFDELPMEDGEGGRGGGRGGGSRSYQHPPVLTTRAAPTNNKWAQAIARGAFEDDDAATVRGMDSMADGNLARMRRAHDTAHNFVTQNYTERSLPRDRQGHVLPRANFRAPGQGGRFQPAINHVGDGPVDIEATLSASSHSAPRERRPATGPPPRHPSVRATPPVLSQIQTTLRRAAIAPVARVQTAPVSTATPPVLEDTKEAPKFQARLPCAFVILKMAAIIKSTALAKQSFPGYIILVSGCEPSEDLIIFSFKDKDAVDVRHPISEYTDHMTQEKGIMLSFTVDDGHKLFYAAAFDGLQDRDKLIESLRKLVDRQQQKSQSASTAPIAAAEGSVTEINPSAMNEPLQPTVKAEAPVPSARPKPPKPTVEAESRVPVARPEASKPTAVVTTQPTELVVPPRPVLQSARVIQPAPVVDSTLIVRPAPVAQPIPAAKPAPAAEQVFPAVPQTPVVTAAEAQFGSAASFGIGITAELIDDMMSWVWDTSKHMRDCTPDFGFDMIRTIIRGTAGAILKREFPVFLGLPSPIRTHIVETECRPVLERRFLQQIASNPTLVDELAGQDASNENEGKVKANRQPLATRKELEAPVPQAPHAPEVPNVYAINELEALRGTATEPPGWVGPMTSLATRDSKQQRHDGPSFPPIQWDNQTMPSVDEQVKQKSAHNTEWLYPSKTAEPARNIVIQAVPVVQAAPVTHAVPVAAPDDDLADFLSGKPALQKTVGHNNQLGLGYSRHNPDNENTNNANKPSYMNDLTSLKHN